MKLQNARLIVVVIVAMMSIGSYIFLTTVSVSEQTQLSQPDPAKMELDENVQQKTILEEVETGMALPDVHLLKFIIKTGKRFLPAS